MSGRRFFRTIQVKLVIIYLLLILVAMQLIGVYFISTVKASLTDNFTTNLKEQADILSKLAAKELYEKPNSDSETDTSSTEDLSLVVRNLFSISGTEVQVLDGNGRVVATSLQVPESYIGKKNTSLAVSRALTGISENEEEIIDENGTRKKIIALPVTYNDNDKVVGAVYMLASMDSLYDTVNRVNQIFFSGTLIALGLTGILGILLAHTITSPIQGLTRQAAAVADGKFDLQVPVLGDDEIGRLSLAFNDMTIRLKEALSVNEEENEKLASILSNMSDGVIAADENGKVIVWNRRSQEMLDVRTCEGCSLPELLGMPVQKYLELQNGREQTVILPRSEEEAEMDDEEGVLRVTFTPIHRRDKGITGTIAVLQDVTEQEKLEQSRRQFVANVSHELRTPLTTIKSYAEALNDGALDERELSERFVGVIRNETERMIRLVTDLLHLSRLDSNQAPLRRRKTNIHEMLDEVADRFSFQLRQKSILASIVVDRDLKSAWLDRDQIDQVLDNLISNAIKYTLEGGAIELSAHKQDAATIAISVKDTGIGIPKKDLSRIFDRFYRVDKARSRNMGGTGLGLSIAREIVKAHGGTISLKSELNEGTTVTFTLPALQEEGETA
ncbi:MULTISPECIES: cell wall metabolism sensor histidine kinase WalK [unclassified Paenibacillus]|uniref:cell wall metabolism sensor histidine kinase WalK n=1 Tax=unclassified Paenibacillus TaxID=185978 RepID=UPI00104AD56A|nr:MULTISPECIES: cell wall metabolism sensor histidine kinase WalK [unclassified Paenibacillus]NIK71445.1 two-component system sensor histidine kinase VicK [Paenibacillus sp. BK720]TCM96838.1 two-component system sensor histidine kinase VicK [Paenibacillus sp. BK033]